LDRPEGLAVGHHYATDGPLPRPTPLVIYVADTGNDRIQRFSSDGQPLGNWGGTGSAPGQFMTPRGVAMDDKSRLYVADTGNDRVQVLAPDGQPSAQWPMEKPTGIAVDGRGFVYVTRGVGAGGMKEFGPDGQVVAEWGGEGVLPDPFAPQPHEAVAADAVGNVYVVDVKTSGSGGVWYWSRAEALAMQIRKAAARLLELLGDGQSGDDSAKAAAIADLVAKRRANLEQLVELDPQVALGVLGESGSARLRNIGGTSLGTEDEVSGLEGAVVHMVGDGFGPDGPVSMEIVELDRSGAEPGSYLQVYAEPSVLRDLVKPTAAAVDGFRVGDRLLVRSARVLACTDTAGSSVPSVVCRKP
jgi:hypothetical protein